MNLFYRMALKQKAKGGIKDLNKVMNKNISELFTGTNELTLQQKEEMVSAKNEAIVNTIFQINKLIEYIDKNDEDNIEKVLIELKWLVRK